MQVGDIVKVVDYDSDDSPDIKINGRTGTIVRINERTNYIEVDLGIPPSGGNLGISPSGAIGDGNWLFFARELEAV